MLGVARQGKAWPGMARCGSARLGYYGGILRSATSFKRTTGRGKAERGLVGYGEVWRGQDRRGRVFVYFNILVV